MIRTLRPKATEIVEVEYQEALDDGVYLAWMPMTLNDLVLLHRIATVMAGAEKQPTQLRNKARLLCEKCEEILSNWPDSEGCRIEDVINRKI